MAKKLVKNHLKHLLAHYYNVCEEAVVNDRFSSFYHGYLTKEYKSGVATRIDKWEMCRGLGLSLAIMLWKTIKMLFQQRSYRFTCFNGWK